MILSAQALAADNPYLAGAIRLYADLEYESALAQLQKAESWKGNGPAEDVTIHLYMGLVQAELGKVDAAAVSFKAALALDPQAQLPAKVSPKVGSIFDKARSELVKARLHSRPETSIRDEPTKTPASPTNPAPVHVARPADTPVATAPAQPPVIVQATPQPTTTPGFETPAPPTAVSETSHSYVAPIVLVIAAAAVAGGGGFFGWQSSQSASAARAAQFQDDAASHLSDARTFAWVANGAYIGAGVLGLVALGVAVANR